MGATPLFPRGRVTIMGILNATPDSFSDGGLLYVAGTLELERAVDHGRRLEAAGAHVIDVGGESTRPGSTPVPIDAEIARTAPLVEALVKATRLPISIDTRKGAVARAALEAGAQIVNDVSGGRSDPDLLDAVARFGATVVLGHLRGEPATMQDDPRFDDVLDEVACELAVAAENAVEAGVPGAHIVVDPGIGFGKRLEDNLALLARPGWLAERLGRPVLVGPSRKTFLERLTGDPVGQRDSASVAACAVAVFAGADAIRVHDVAGGVRAAAVGRALREAAQRNPTPPPEAIA